MNYRLYKEDDFHIENSGGETEIKELAVFPDAPGRGEQAFIWKLSLARTEQEERELEKLPDYDRVLLVLEGETVLAYEGQRVARLKELEQDRFDGAFSAKSFGRRQDYNLIVKKGNAGYLDVLKLSPHRQEPEQESPGSRGKACQAFYCHEGYGVVVFAGETCMVKEGQQLVIFHDAEEPLSPGVMGEGVLIRAQIFYDTADGEAETGETAAEGPHMDERKAGSAEGLEAGGSEARKERGTPEDFKECMKLSLTNFRGSRFVFPYLKTVWYDESLQAGIRKIERFYLPVFLWFAGIAGLGLRVGGLWQPVHVLYALLLWTALVLFVLSPLMYFLAVPKPVKAHIRPLSEMTDYEKRLWKQEREANPAADRILKKYKITARNVYIEDDQPKRTKKKPRA